MGVDHHRLAEDVVAARRGDVDAFARLVREHAGVVCAITTGILGSPALGEEVGQDVFVHAWQGLPSLREPRSFGAWIRQMARHRAHNALRSQLRRREHALALDGLAATGAEVDEVLDEARQEAAMWAAFEELPPPDREVLALFYCQEGSVRAVAEQLELTEVVVRKRLSRARARLREDVTAALEPRLARRVSAAFLAAVAAAVAVTPQPAQARSRSALGWAALALCLALPVAGGAPSPAQGPPVPPKRASLPPPVEGDEPVRALETVTVLLGSWEDGSVSASEVVPFNPAFFWPYPDEISFPEAEAANVLREHVLFHAGDPLSGEVLDAIEELRVEELPGDPWAAFWALEAERLYAQEQGAPVQLGWMLSLAQQVQEAWPAGTELGWPLAEVAEMYELEALSNADAETWDPEAVGRKVMHMLQEGHGFEDRVLGATGAQARLELEELDLLLGTLHPSTLDWNRGITVCALETALELQDLERAAVWLPHHHQAVEAWCESHAGRSERRAQMCGAYRHERDHWSGWLAAQGAAEPATWQAALGATVHRCHAEGHPLSGELLGEGHFDGAWRWTSWTGDPAFAACIARSESLEPTPPLGTEVRLEVLPAD